MEQKIQADLVFLSGTFKGRRVPLTGRRICIGRAPGCEVLLDDETSSRHHTELILSSGRLLVHDLKSTNGTFVNGTRIENAELHNGDRLAVGATVFMVELRAPRQLRPTTVIIVEQQRALTTHMTLNLDESRMLRLRADVSIVDAQQQLDGLQRFILLTTGLLHLPALIQRALDFMIETFDAERAVVLMLGPDETPGTQFSRWKTPPEGEQEITLPRSLLQQLVQRKQSSLSEETETKPVADNKYITRSILGIPLKAKDRLLGLLYLDTASRQFTPDDLKLCTVMALHLASGIENASLYAELLDAAEFNNSVLRSVASGMLVVDLDGLVTHVNRAALEILKQDEQKLLHRPLTDHEDLTPLAEVIYSTLETGRLEDRYEVQLDTDGETLPLGLTSALLTDHAGEKVGVVASFRNLTSLRRLEKELQQAQHLAMLGQMSAGVAHEIRNPLNSIRGFAQLISEESGECGKSECAEYSKILVDEVDRMNRIIQDLLDFSRDRDIELNPMAVDELLQQIAQAIYPDYKEANVELALQLPSEPLPPILGNPDKLTQVLRNILQNALQASNAGTHVALTASVMEHAEGQPRQISVSIADQGHGIPAQSLDRIFEHFFTLKAVGTGLGLAICHKLIEQHNGLITVKSEEDKGTTFTLFLPVYEPEEPTA